MHACLLTRVDLSVGGNSVGVHDGLESLDKSVTVVIRGRGLLGRHGLDDGGDGAAADFLHNDNQMVYSKHYKDVNSMMSIYTSMHGLQQLL